MNVALYCRNIKREDVPVFQKILDLLAVKKIGVFIYKNFFRKHLAGNKNPIRRHHLSIA
jgi:hypothetical protein